MTDPIVAAGLLLICVFAWEEDHTIWRHMQNSGPPEVHGLLRQIVVVNSVATVGNYDYLTEVKFREDGEVGLGTHFLASLRAEVQGHAQARATRF